MKNRFICFITLLFIIVTLIGTLASCTNKKIQVVDPEIQEEIDKKVIAASKIASMVMENNLEGAYFRMSGDFRTSLSYEMFIKNWESAVKDFGELKNFTVDTSEYSLLASELLNYVPKVLRNL